MQDLVEDKYITIDMINQDKRYSSVYKELQSICTTEEQKEALNTLVAYIKASGRINKDVFLFLMKNQDLFDSKNKVGNFMPFLDDFADVV